MSKIVRILGAGPAGLAAAIVLARHGARVEIFERRLHIGGRFHGDFQGLENWSIERDVLDELEEIGIKISFAHTPFCRGRIYNPALVGREISVRRPIFYMVKRGTGPDTLDTGLERQAIEAGAVIHYNQSLSPIDADIIATGPRGTHAIAAGITFETTLPDSAYVVVGERLAPRGYTYLLVADHQATLATVLFDKFKTAPECLEQTVGVYRRLLNLDMAHVRRWGGYGSFQIPQTAVVGGKLYVGEAAGFQDFLFGFGIRSALVSGYLAAKSIIEEQDYDALWKRRLLRPLRSSEFNRRWYSRLGNLAYYGLWVALGYGPRPDAFMRWLYTWRG